ncbi:galactokinase [Rugosimonospora africana]|uniref:Galactokinase n=1 Tax=Rugosimonospora africana TaxID=556532 RepID=A0A8J3VNQ8_9ACTN|nr:galactokinase [Rugosimonospora africana]GIH12596.1 galactokinase [Rugosimonospora africana]
MSFTDIFGHAPTGAWSAPGRVNLIGEHTDYNEGFVLPFALPQRTTVEASPVDGPMWTVWSAQSGETVSFGADDLVPGKIDGWAGYVAGVIWALRKFGFDPGCAQLAVSSDVPVGAGLSSSAALECAVLTALVDLYGLDLPVPKRPTVAQAAENGYVGMPCGIMDQSASTLCRDGYALFQDCRSLAVEHIPFELTADGLSVLVIDTNAPHRHTDNEYAARRQACEKAAAALNLPALRDVTDLDAALAALPDEVTRRRVRHVVTENQRVLDTVAVLRGGDVRRIGPLLTASHASMRDDYEITVPEVDTAVEAALAAGAYGARMTGGGFGGCVLALVDTAKADQVGTAVANAYAARGFTAPTWFVAVPSEGAHRLS